MTKTTTIAYLKDLITKIEESGTDEESIVVLYDQTGAAYTVTDILTDELQRDDPEVEGALRRDPDDEDLDSLPGWVPVLAIHIQQTRRGY